MRPRRNGVSDRLTRQCARVVSLLLLCSAPSFPQQRLETPQETNERIRQLALALQVKQGDYVIGSGDLVRIDVFDVPELSRDVRVGHSGYISLPLIPTKIRAQGLTAFQLEEKLAELLQVNGLVSHPQVSVFVKEQRSQPITVVGSVRRPVVYQAVRQTTLLEVLSEAGGVADDAGSVVLVTRVVHEESSNEQNGSAEAGGSTSGPETTTLTIKLNDVLESGNTKFNIPLLPGDLVTVPHAGIVYVLGAVQKAGGFVLQNAYEEMTALRVLALAGGFKPAAKASRSVILRKNPETGQREEVDVDLKKVLQRKTEDVRLYSDDILFVPDSTGRKALRRTGEIAIGVTTGAALFRVAR
jgi:polysaccharide biosynthesis/export protein